MRFVFVALLLALLVPVAGCVRHNHHHYRAAAILDNEHSDRAIVVAHKRPGPNRVCWKHRAHWHCRVR